MPEPDEDAIVKGQVGYRVVWEEPSDKPVQPKPVPRKPAREADEKFNLWFIHGTIVFLLFVWMILVVPHFAWIVLVLAALAGAVFLYQKHRHREYVNSMAVQMVRLEILHPIKTGFEFALGMGLFVGTCIIVGAIIAAVLIATVAYGVWNYLSGFLPF